MQIQNRKKILYKALPVLLSFCTSMAVNMSFQMPKLSEAQKSNIVTEILWNICKSLNRGGVNATLIFVCLLLLNRIIIKEKKINIDAVSIGLSIIWLTGESFKIDNTLRMIIASPGQIVKSICYLIGIAWLLRQFGHLLYQILNERHHSSFCIVLMGRHPFLYPFLTIFVCWIPHIVVSYPCYGVYGTWSALGQVYGISKFTGHLPPLYTLLIGYTVKLTEYFGNCNLGLFSFVVFQTVVFAVILAYMIYTLKIQLKSPEWLLALIIVCAIFVPYYSDYLGVILRDNLYSYAVLLLLVELLYLLLMETDYFECTRHCLLLGLSICSIVWFRKNGIYMIFPTILVFFLYTMLQVKKLSRGKRNKYILKVFLTLFLPIIFANGVSAHVMIHYQIEPGSIREALSLPFQQTARYALEYGNEITEEEAAAISGVLDYEHLAENYNPRISDPVKRTFNENATKEDLKQYFIVWLKQFFKHPLVYVKATLNQNYYILYPYTENDMIYTRIAQGGSPSRIVENLSEKLDIYEPNWLIQFKITIEAYYKLLFVLPVFGVLSSLAFYNILLVFCFSFSIQQKQYKWILLSIPLILSDIIIVLAPAIQEHPRYAFPIFYATPVVIAYYIYLVSAGGGQAN